jgi:hypothetical protein
MPAADDIVANARAFHRDNPAMLAMYRGESGPFRAALFVAGMCEAMWAEHDRLVAVD